MSDSVTDGIDIAIDMLEAPGRHVTSWDGAWTDQVAADIIVSLREERDKLTKSVATPR